MAGRVTGLGGVFFRSKDPEARVAWYQEHLGVPSHGPWPQEAGISVFAPFSADTDYWPEGEAFMLNFRVEDLDALVAKLEAAGIAVERRPDEWDTAGIGRFARITDPEGLPVELWEPAS